MIVGIIGGGQLGRMFIQNGLRYGFEFHVLDPDPQCPCAAIAHHFVCADRNDEQAVIDFGQVCDVITIEIENVSATALRKLAASGKQVYPQASVIETIRDKGLQKLFYQKHGIPTAPFYLCENRSEIDPTKLPAMQKLRVGGYDGKGVKPLRTAADIANAFDQPCVMEEWVPFDLEVAVIVVRRADGTTAAFDPVELVFDPRANLVDYLVWPARLSNSILSEAKNIAEKIAEKLEIVGLLGVEMFVTKTGDVLVNEVAPRPHNSGHHTIEACHSSQFDQHLRAIANLPLGKTIARSAAAMINLVGEPDKKGTVHYSGLSEVLDVEGAYVHLYGKNTTSPFRKMGHITVLGHSADQALEKAQALKGKLKATTL